MARENSRHMLADILTFISWDVERTTQDLTMRGEARTLMLQIHDLDPGPDDPYAPAFVYITAPAAAVPTWDGTDVFAVDAASVIAGDVGQPRTILVNGYVRDHVWVSDDFNESPMSHN